MSASRPLVRHRGEYVGGCLSDVDRVAGQGLYQSLGLPLPGQGKAGYPLLVYGGSTATGTLAIQYGVL